MILAHSTSPMEVVLLFIGSNMLRLYKFYKSFGRMGELEGLFVASDEEIKHLKGKALDFGEALGKHSEICFAFEKSQIKLVTEDQDFIEKFKEILPNGVGTTPFDGLDD